MSIEQNTGTPRLYAFAGIDGAGKTTLINHVAGELKADGHQVDISKAYEDSKKATLKEWIKEADPIELMFIFQALHRAQRVQAGRLLESGSIVLADRWSEAYEAYHAHNGVLSRDKRLRVSLGRLAFDNVEPERTFYVRLDPREAMRRSHIRGADFFDSKQLAYHQRHADHYDQAAQEHPNWVTLDGMNSVEDLSQEVHSYIIPDASVS